MNKENGDREKKSQNTERERDEWAGLIVPLSLVFKRTGGKTPPYEKNVIEKRKGRKISVW
jgi:hypothetical protein